MVRSIMMMIGYVRESSDEARMILLNRHNDQEANNLSHTCLQASSGPYVLTGLVRGQSMHRIPPSHVVGGTGGTGGPNPLPEPKCHYGNCHPTDPKKLNVHLVPHTHNDVGWLKTLDQYYWGSKQGVQNAGVQYILDSVVQALDGEPDRRFIYVETAFFWKWWTHQTDTVKDTVKRLVNNGQLELISGGWSMNDEANSHYSAIIDQMTWGFKRLRDILGEPCGVPRIGWQIDPFGHSREQASLLAQMGFDGMFFSRLDYEDRDKRVRDRTLEMVWRGSDDIPGERSDLFTGAMYLGYVIRD
ncbi:unnamed protein product [Medioppia subpectinata]|uniref:Glycoside hydrolase family 38 N-terminal domain-containing protein n=1 Tax=Medioppia subpectinata TaxID=1979941 RepID=A0A7R9Q1J6_9ACAR|nr:unnamed protein product [Medioppia subpectinata]CAG2109290.1 unnamed protein product [Medioppia subpectinata]